MNSRYDLATQPPRILIVDDEPHNRTLLEVMLAPEGFRVLTAAGGAEALATVARDRPDLILLDVMMPEMDGYQVAAALKGSLATRNIPIIMLTAFDDRNAKMSGLSAGAEDFLTKPVDRGELSVRVRNLLRLKSHADDALARRDDSMGMVSHELRNLLNGIVVGATLLVDEATDSDEGRRTVAGMKIIQGYAARMNRLVGDLVDVVSIDAGKLALKPARCDAGALLAETLESFTQAAAEKGISLEAAAVVRALPADFDRERILQVLVNLVSNALKFTPRGGAIKIRVERTGNENHFSVSDTGPGIPGDLLEAVFDRFLQVTKNDQRGLGLGLYISKCIVASHGGKIWVESTLGAGSVFHFTIPAPKERAGGRVLIVDDDRAMCETLALCLVRRGFTVAWSTSARDALALLGGQDFDVMVTDLNMDEMDGLALCERVAVLRPGLPVIVTTAFGTPAIEVAAASAGAYAFMTKPFDLESLRLTLVSAVQSVSAA